jgi:uncharacterized membrane protein YkoI
MKLNLTRRTLAIAGAAAVLAGGGATVAVASASSAPAGDAADAQQADGEHQDGNDGGPGSAQEAEDPSYTGTVRAPAETEQTGGHEGAGSDAQEQAVLTALATVTAAQAEQSALAAVPGTVSETDLDNENGFVVYSVEINGADGTVTEVTVDAGNGSVLAQQVQGAEDPADGPDQAEQPGDPQD